MVQREMATKARSFVLEKIHIINTLLIICHLGFAVIYDLYDMDILFYTNFGNIALCLLAFVFLKKKKLKEYVHFTFYELYVFMVVSIVFLGWDLGFQHYCISFTIAIFFCDFYLNKNYSINKRSIAMGIFNMCLYVGLRIWTFFFPHVYIIENPAIETSIFIVNSILTFFFIIMYMFIYSTTVNKLENDLRNIAEKDALTGLYNRRKMMQMLKDSIATTKDSKLMVAMFDVDFFKNINDTYGHAAGDEVLKKLAYTLANHDLLKYTSSVCRWGGEEFLALHNYTTSKDSVIETFETVRKSVENLNIQYEGKTINITITIGLAFYQNGISLDTLLKEVDSQLYKGKETGRNKVVY